MSHPRIAARMLHTGHVVQVQMYEDQIVVSGAGVIPFDGSIPQITEGNQFINVSITPKSASNILIIDGLFSGYETSNSYNYGFCVALFKQGQNDALATWYGDVYDYTTERINTIPFAHKMVAGGTSPILFRLHAGVPVGSTSMNRGAGGLRYGGTLSSYMRVWEIAA